MASTLVEEISAAVEDVLHEHDIAEALDRVQSGSPEAGEVSGPGPPVGAELLEEVKSQLRLFLMRSLAAAEWNRFLGPLWTHKQVITATRMTKQSLSQATRAHRVLKLRTGTGKSLYPRWQFNHDTPARPLPPLQPLFRTWSTVDPTGWTAASWICSPQVELDGTRTPLDVVCSNDVDAQRRLPILAEQSMNRLRQ